MLIKSNILRSPHAFTTRRGGVSALDHTKSLNLAFERGDGDGVVLENLRILAQRVGFDEKSLVSLPQIHSDKIFTVTTQMRGRGYFVREGIECGDGYVTGEMGIALGIKTADCTPILFEAEKNGEIVAVGAVHAGWKGTALDIAGKCVEKLTQEFDVDAKDIRAAIGPCIHACCYEVGDDLYREIALRLGKDIANRFVLPSQACNGKYFCDLVGINRHLLLSRGLLAENIDIIDECTCCNPEKYYSHRYSKGHRGTMLNLIFME